MDIDFGPEGEISGYKTEFLKNLAPEVAFGDDKVFIYKPTKESIIAACLDVDGHLCSLCSIKKHKFVEIKSHFILPSKICFDCLKQAVSMEKLLDN
jgi:hypothetical protein